MDDSMDQEAIKSASHGALSMVNQDSSIHESKFDNGLLSSSAILY